MKDGLDSQIASFRPSVSPTRISLRIYVQEVCGRLNSVKLRVTGLV